MLLPLVVAVLVAPAQGAEPITGARFDSLSAAAVDVMRLHQGTMKAQMDRDEVARVYEATIRSMSGDFVDRNGAVIESDLARFLHTNWFGKGNPATGTAWFAGMQIDAAIVGSGSLGSLPYNGELLLFGGAASHGWQGSLAVRGERHQGVYPDGSFVEGLSIGGDSAGRTGSGGGGVILSLQQQEGAAFGLVFDDEGFRTEGDRRDVLSAARALIQPEAAMERANLRKAGVPSLALERIAGRLDPWAEQDPGDPDPPAIWQVPLAIDDLGGVGLRLRVVPEIAPEPGLRLAEGGLVFIQKWVVLGGRGGVWRSADVLRGSGEGFATVVASRQDDDTEGLAITLSAARNVPDAATFFLIPDATVFGLGVTFGPLDMTHATLPVLASQDRYGL